MVNFTNLWNFLFTKKVAQKAIAYLLLILCFYLLKGFLLVFFLTFIFGYLFLSAGKFLKWHIDSMLLKKCSSEQAGRAACKMIPLNLIIVIEYLVFIFFIVFTLSSLIPKLVTELSAFTQTVPVLSEQIEVINYRLEEISMLNNQVWIGLEEIISSKDIDVIIQVWGKLKEAGFIVLKIFLALILSFIFIVDRFRLAQYLWGIKKSSFWFLYKEYEIIFDKIIKSFGLIFKAQASIAFVNMVLTTLGLVLIWIIHGMTFPYLLTLALLVFIAGFIPVLGTFISSVPILVVGYSMIGWYVVVLEIIVLISFIHMVEAYYLNPKIVSNFIEVPISLTFIILIISEHFFWIAGLLIGISLFYFFVWLLRDFDKSIKKKTKKINN